MFILKACPKCHGDLAAETRLQRLSDEDDVVCIQCGYCLPPDQTRGLFNRILRYSQRSKQAAAVPVLQTAYAHAGR